MVLWANSTHLSSPYCYAETHLLDALLVKTQNFKFGPRQNFMVFIRWFSSQSYSEFKVKDSRGHGVSLIGRVVSVAGGKASLQMCCVVLSVVILP